MELLLGNALMFTTPLKALAETCEADDSFFNMPLLLSVALIGAAVGGKILLALRSALFVYHRVCG